MKYRCKVCGSIIDNNRICPYCGSDSFSIEKIVDDEPIDNVVKENNAKYKCLACGNIIDNPNHCEYCGADNNYIIEEKESLETDDDLYDDNLESSEESEENLIEDDENSNETNKLEDEYNKNEDEKIEEDKSPQIEEFKNNEEAIKSKDNSLASNDLNTEKDNKNTKILANLNYLIQIFIYFYYKDISKANYILKIIGSFLVDNWEFDGELNSYINEISDEKLRKILEQFQK